MVDNQKKNIQVSCNGVFFDFEIDAITIVCFDILMKDMMNLNLYNDSHVISFF